MTCIAGIKTEKGVWIGGDSAGVAGMEVLQRADKKVFKTRYLKDPEFLIGCTSSFRMIDVLKYIFKPPKWPKNEAPTQDNIHRFMVREFVPKIRQTFKDEGFARTDSGAESGGMFLVGYRGELFCIGSDYQVGIPLEEYDAVGCGDRYARGSLYTTKNMFGRIIKKEDVSGFIYPEGLNYSCFGNYNEEISPEIRIKLALQAATHHNGGVMGPYTILFAEK